jgi:hypothetical protein
VDHLAKLELARVKTINIQSRGALFAYQKSTASFIDLTI